jgi:tetratricopeptide (TPR) repeat protein
VANRPGKKKKRAAEGVNGPAVSQVKQAARTPAAWPAILIVLVFTFLVYIPTLHYQFVYDDVEQIVKNPNIQSWSYLPDYFTKHLWSHGGWNQARFYRPFFLLWLRMNHAFFGLDASYWHFTTLAAHLLATLLVFILVLTLLRNRAPAAIAALFFALHPIHVEVAAWISAVSEALLAASLLASLACFAKSAGKQRKWLAAALFLYASALLMKETAMVFPAIAFAFAWLWSERESRVARGRQALVRTAPFVALTFMYLAVRWSVLKTIVTASAPLAFKTVLLTVPSLLLFYGRLLVWPARLSPFYDTPLVTQPGRSNFVAPMLAVVAVCGGLALLIGKARPAEDAAESAKDEGRLTILACVWMAVFLLPSLYLPALQSGLFVQDRYLYLPSIGFSILLSLGLCRFGRSGRKFAGLPLAQILPALALAALMAAATMAQSRIWADNVSLFTRAVERDPQSRMAQHDLAAALVDAGRNDDAIRLLQKLLREDPDDPVDNNNIGQAYLKKGDRERAEPALTKACQLHPSAGQFYQLGAVRLNMGKLDTAEQAFRQAIAMDASAAGYHLALAVTLERLGKLDEALQELRQELAVNPGDKTTQEELARLSAFLRR